jgi:hypothetical protein
MDKRDVLSDEKLKKLFERAISKSLPNVYSVLDLKLANPDNLEETYDLEMTIACTLAHHVKYDMHDVFTIVKPDTDITIYEFMNLYGNYSMDTTEEVAISNEWYSTMTEDPENNNFYKTAS